MPPKKKSSCSRRAAKAGSGKGTNRATRTANGQAWYDQALTHSSYDGTNSNDNLARYGDMVMRFVLSTRFLFKHPSTSVATDGREWTEWVFDPVSRAKLAAAFDRAQLGELLATEPEEMTISEEMKANTVRAMIGAVCLDLPDDEDADAWSGIHNATIRMEELSLLFAS